MIYHKSLMKKKKSSTMI